eukprot:g8396.t1
MFVLLPFLLQLWFGTTSTTSVLFLACVSCLLNTVGCFLEGLVHNDDDYASFSAGFLSVITSFPDIGDAAKDVILESRKTRSSRGQELQMLLVGVSYCFTGIVCGCLAYGLGLHCPAGAAFGLLLACALSALGSCLGTYIVESVSSSTRLRSLDAEILGRALNNFLACALCVAIRVLCGFETTSFVLYKISTSFCGAVSSMSGTIGDICTSSWSSTSSQNKGNYRANGNEKRTGGRRGAKMVGCNLAFHLGMLITFMVLMLHLANLGEPFLLEMRQERLAEDGGVFVSGSFGRAEDLEEGMAGTETEADVEI